VRVLARSTLVRGPVFDVTAESLVLPSGLRQDLLLVRHPGAVAIAALLPGGELLLVRQYRHALGTWTLELPAGRIEPGEAPSAAARRELEEETGHRAARWEECLWIHPAPGFCSEAIGIFVARDLEEVPAGTGLRPDEDEELALVRRTPRALLEEGGTSDAKTLLAAQHLLLRGVA